MYTPRHVNGKATDDGFVECNIISKKNTLVLKKQLGKSLSKILTFLSYDQNIEKHEG